jgi:hypothetical protein
MNFDWDQKVLSMQMIIATYRWEESGTMRTEGTQGRNQTDQQTRSAEVSKVN